VYRIISVFFAFFIIVAGAAAEEIILKDGTKIVGRMTAISGDTIAVETAYGKMSLKRSDIVSIVFPENDSKGDASGAKGTPKEKVKIEDSLVGAQYINKTGDFSLTLPPDWKINPTLTASSDGIAGLSSRDNLRYLLVVREDFSGSLESYKGLSEMQAKKNLQDFEKLSESPIKIDNWAGLLITYRGVSVAAGNLPIEFLTAIISNGNTYYRISTWCVEPLFKESQPIFEKVIYSYHNTKPASSTLPVSNP
jgi:hypothetical protein